MVKVVLWSFFILPWISLFLLNNSVIRRYIPVALFATVVNTIMYQIAWAYDSWKYNETLFWWDNVAQIHAVNGVFWVGTIWIFYFTFRKFWIYLVVNLIVDCIYSFGFRALWKKLKITTGYGNLSPLEAILIMTIMAIIFYVYQMWQEGLIGRENENSVKRVT